MTSTRVLLEDSIRLQNLLLTIVALPRSLSGNTTTLYSLGGSRANQLNCEGPSPTLTTALLSLALPTIMFLVKRVEIPFFPSLVNWTTQPLPAASTTSMGSFAVPYGHWISVAPVISTTYSTLTVITSLKVRYGVIVPTPSPSMR